MVFELVQDVEVELGSAARLMVMGIGGAGVNAVNRMIATGLDGVDFVVLNTDNQVLERSAAPRKLCIGKKLTKGLGAGGDPEIGRKAAEEDKDVIAECLEDVDMVFLTAGMGGGTGTGASPIIAKLAKEMQILTVAVVTRPFNFEGKTRFENAERGIEELKAVVDTLIIIPNEKLLSLVERDTTFTDAFCRADEVLFQATQGISELITKPGLINLDFSDVSSVLKERGGDALMGTGIATPEEGPVEAAQKAIACPLLDNVSITGAKGVLINITGGPSLSLTEAAEAASLIAEQAGQEADTKFGVVIDEEMNEQVKVTVIAAGFQKKAKLKKAYTNSSISQRFAQAMDIFSTEGEIQKNTSTNRNEMESESEAEYKPATHNRENVHAPTFIPSDKENESIIPEPNQESEAEINAKESTSSGLLDFSPDDYEVPAFIRKNKASGE
ncbi:cell division protein FtsZ [bacterium]|nr:MAG: cell division protein FtsZ [bacterium]